MSSYRGPLTSLTHKKIFASNVVNTWSFRDILVSPIHLLLNTSLTLVSKRLSNRFCIFLCIHFTLFLYLVYFLYCTYIIVLWRIIEDEYRIFSLKVSLLCISCVFDLHLQPPCYLRFFHKKILMNHALRCWRFSIVWTNSKSFHTLNTN